MASRSIDDQIAIGIETSRESDFGGAAAVFFDCDMEFANIRALSARVKELDIFHLVAAGVVHRRCRIGVCKNLVDHDFVSDDGFAIGPLARTVLADPRSAVFWGRAFFAHGALRAWAAAVHIGFAGILSAIGAEILFWLAETGFAVCRDAIGI